MKIYKISQSLVTGWDTYSDAVVIAKDEDEARHISPAGGMLSVVAKDEFGEDVFYYDDWIRPEDVNVVVVEYLGESASTDTTPRVVCASFHAG